MLWPSGNHQYSLLRPDRSKQCARSVVKHCFCVRSSSVYVCFHRDLAVPNRVFSDVVLSSSSKNQNSKNMCGK